MQNSTSSGSGGQSDNSTNAKDSISSSLPLPPHIPLTDSMEQSLKQLLVQCASTGKFNKENVSSQMSDEDKKFIEAALESTVNSHGTENTLTSMARTLEKFCAEQPRKPTEEELRISELLEELTEDLHAGDEFIALGGIKLCSSLLDSNHPMIRETSCNIIANIASNNPTFQTHSDGNGLVKRLLQAAARTTQKSFKTKLLYAASCAISSNSSRIQSVLEDPELGIEFLFKLYTDDSDLNSRNRTGRIIASMFRDVPLTAKLDHSQISTFASTLIDTAETNSFMVANLQVIYSIYTSPYPGIKKQIRTELGTTLIGILKNLPSPVSDDSASDLSADDTGISESLKAFQRSLETDTADPETSSAPLAIRM